MNLIAVDPGKVAGVALLTGPRLNTATFLSYELPWLDAIDELERYVYGTPPASAHMAVERFTITAHTAKHTQQVDALEMIGACRVLARRNHIEFWMQSPGERNIATRAILQARGWWFPTKDGHRNDAAKHLLVLALRLGIVDPGDLL
jgi:hypothetical protein